MREETNQEYRGFTIITRVEEPLVIHTMTDYVVAYITMTDKKVDISKFKRLIDIYLGVELQKVLSIQSTEVKEIVEHLNQVCRTNYKHTSAKTKTLVNARLKDGFTIDNFRKVHITKYAEWYGTDMQKYLRPETLYGTKFESYLNQELTINDKYKAVSNHTGMSALEILREQGRA
jgi:uncharacterized phage protein (TIGR02220 family)